MAYTRKPISFGGLKVSYIPTNLSQTSKNNRFSQILRFGSQKPPSPTTAIKAGLSNTTSSTSATQSVIQTVTLKTNDYVEARKPNTKQDLGGNGDPHHPYSGKVALRTKYGNSEYLTVSTHVLHNAFAMKTSFFFRKSKSPGGSTQDLKKKLEIYKGKCKVSDYDIFVKE